MLTELPAKSEAPTMSKNVTVKRKQKQNRSPLVPWWRAKTTQKPKRVLRPTVSASTTSKVVWDARAYYFPGALPKISEAIIFVNPLSEELSKATTTTTSTLDLVTTQKLKSSKLHVSPTRATKSEMAKSTTVPAQVSDFDMELPILKSDATINREILFPTNSSQESLESTQKLVIGFSFLGILCSASLMNFI